MMVIIMIILIKLTKFDYLHDHDQDHLDHHDKQLDHDHDHHDRHGCEQKVKIIL